MQKRPQHTLLVLSRKGRGIGGMQQLSKDLLRGFRTWKDVRVISLTSTYVLDTLFFFPIHSLIWSVFLPRGSRVHLCDASLSPLGALISFIRPSLKITITACGLDVIYSKKWYQFLLGHSLKRIDHIVCISNATAEKLSARDYPADRITVIPCGIWEEDIVSSHKAHKDTGTLLSVGRLVPRKGVKWFVESVFPILINKYPDIQYVIVGKGKMASGKHIRNVRIVGGVDRDTRDELYNQANVLVVPNLPTDGDMEGFGIVCIEASARGVPVVAANLEGLQDAVIDGVTGKFFQPENPESCAATIISLLENPLSSESISKKTIEMFDWQKLLPRYRNVFVF